ncbi:MAG: nicotinate-nucleotide--dimethylbenzimidazole phosphoribosyltransferase [Lachnospiraceae bacterium]|nr:nicotinate-nucleotide--dimethylbenzimidazole phosphoribosyltransferase [Lachnospiraceae bacterium]
MECLKKPIWNKYTREELEQFIIEKPEEEIRKVVLENWDAVAKPMDGMGRFETLTAQIGAITGTDKIDLSKKAVIIMCADNGIVDEKVSQSGQEVTLAVAKAMAKKQSSVGRMAAVIGADTIPVDIGINSKEMIQGVLNRKIRCGTRNFRKESAMTEEETIHAILVGIDMVGSCKKMDYKILATGEMGIGNTTTSSAIAAAVLQCEVSKVTGKGAGLSDEGLYHKKQIIEEAIKKYDLYHADALKILQTVGGLDIAGLVGVCIGGAVFHVPIVLDGVISMVAALLAERILPGTKSYLLPSHKGKEPAVEVLMKELDMEPVIDGKLALGEGTGAVMLFSLLDMALGIYYDRTTFSDIQIEQYQRFQ